MLFIDTKTLEGQLLEQDNTLIVAAGATSSVDFSILAGRGDVRALTMSVVMLTNQQLSRSVTFTLNVNGINIIENANGAQFSSLFETNKSVFNTFIREQGRVNVKVVNLSAEECSVITSLYFINPSQVVNS